MDTSLFDEYRALLETAISFKTVSADPACKEQSLAFVEWLSGWLRESGFKVSSYETSENPIIHAAFQAGSDYPTCLLYGHYDVQPAEVEEGWLSDPFVLTERDGRLIGRGTSDNKGQLCIHLTMLRYLIANGTLRHNVDLVIEGNEENGSQVIDEFFEAHKDLMNPDFVMISDSENDIEHPYGTSGCRGVMNASLTVTTSKHDMHSGLFGGAFPNAALELSRILSTLYGAGGRVRAEGFYAAEVPKPSLTYGEFPQTLAATSGTKVVFAETAQDFETLTGNLSSIEITGIAGGYTGQGYKNSIPREATAKINIRLAPGPSIKGMEAVIKEHFAAHIPDYCDYVFSVDESIGGVFIENDNKFSRHMESTWLKVVGKPTSYKNCGGSLPVLLTFEKAYGVPQVLTGLANEDCLMHAANENIGVEYVKTGLAFSEAFFNTSVI